MSPNTEALFRTRALEAEREELLVCLLFVGKLSGIDREAALDCLLAPVSFGNRIGRVEAEQFRSQESKQAMEALKMAAGSRIQCLESAVVSMSGSASSPSSCATGGTSAADCGAFRCCKQKKFCAPVGLSGEGLSGARRSRSGRTSFSSGTASSSRPRLSRVSSLTSPSWSTGAPAPVLSLQGESLLKDIEWQDMEAETPSLLRQCSDLDWRKLVDDLRSEALCGLESGGLRALSLKALEKLIGPWIHEQMADGIERLSGGTVSTEPGWSFEAAATDLRMEANLKAAQVLAKGVDSTFDWETDVAELHQRILLQGGAEPSVLRPEQRLWQAWAHARGEVTESSNQLEKEALASTPVNGHAESLDSEPQAEVLRSTSESRPNGSAPGKSLFVLGTALATSLAVEGTGLLDAIAKEASPQAIEAAARAPSWLVPAVLVFPPLSYFIFNVYRDKVNPYAKLTDWMFGVVALTIVSNIVMIAVWGVRLY